MSKQIDHVVVATRELGRLASLYETLGFTLTPRAEHGWGTANRLVQLEGRNFFELLEIDRPEVLDAAIARTGPSQFSFGAHVKAFLERREGMCMLVLEGSDAEADVAAFRAAGLDTYEPFHFERNATLPDGRTVKVAFSLAFATHAALPGVAFFTCHNRFPENFWKPGFQRHANGARAISEVVLVAPEPAAASDFCEGFSGGAAEGVDGGFFVPCGPQRLTVLAPAAFASRYRDQTVSGEDARFGAVVIERAPGADAGAPAVDAGGVLIEWA